MTDMAAQVLEEDPDTEEEFRALFMEAEEAQARLKALGLAEQQAGRPELGKIYQELAGTVVSLLGDFAATSGGAFRALEETVDGLADQVETDAPTESVLLPEDAEDYQKYFAQMSELLTGLSKSLSDGDAEQRTVIEALQRLTQDRIEFTKEITFTEEDVDDDEEPSPPNGKPKEETEEEDEDDDDE